LHYTELFVIVSTEIAKFYPAIFQASSNPVYLSKLKLLITGGAGFIGSALIRKLLAETNCRILNVDKLTYAAVPGALDEVAAHPRYHFIQHDICDLAAMRGLFADFQPHAVMHLAAETHVDRSIDGAADFIQTNVVGTYTLLQAALEYWQGLSAPGQENFRFQHISTDEVFGPTPADTAYSETTPYRPSSPYAASKASADHLIMAWYRTYGLPVLVSTCTNNYGPFQFPEKLIPLTLVRATSGQVIPIYGNGLQERDWLHVDDHVTGLMAVLASGRIGQVYALASGITHCNLEVVNTLCDILDLVLPQPARRHHADLISFVEDRPGHDIRYALDAAKAKQELDWQPRFALTDGLEDTIKWYLKNRTWWEGILATVYDGERLGRAPAAASSHAANK
jgi:dTDP-glucose 4,6-dehydratase